MKKATHTLCALISASAFAGLPPSEFAEDGFYKITTVVDGQELALTFIPPGDACRKSAQTTCPSKSRVVLEKYKGEPTQLWRPYYERVDPGHIYALFSKFSDQEKDLTGVLLVYDPDIRFLSDKDYKEKHNRITVGMHSPESNALWAINKLPNGKWRINSLVHVMTEKEDPYPSYWREARSLEGRKTEDGKFEVRNGKNSDAPGQQWTITQMNASDE